jgi:hypothetical protein
MADRAEQAEAREAKLAEHLREERERANRLASKLDEAEVREAKLREALREAADWLGGLQPVRTRQQAYERARAALSDNPEGTLWRHRVSGTTVRQVARPDHGSEAWEAVSDAKLREWAKQDHRGKGNLPAFDNGYAQAQIEVLDLIGRVSDNPEEDE